MNVKTSGELRTARHVVLLRTFRCSEAPNRLYQVQLCVALRKTKYFLLPCWLQSSLLNFFSAPIIDAFVTRVLMWFRLFADSFLGHDAVAILVAL